VESDVGLKNRRPFIPGDELRGKGLIKSGNLYIQNDNGTTDDVKWRIHLFRLYKNVLFYVPRRIFAKDKKLFRPIPLVDAIAYPEEGTRRNFQLAHPFITYDITATNEVMRDEWVALINKNRKDRAETKPFFPRQSSLVSSQPLGKSSDFDYDQLEASSSNCLDLANLSLSNPDGIAIDILKNRVSVTVTLSDRKYHFKLNTRKKSRFSIGRCLSSDIVLVSDSYVSRKHALIKVLKNNLVFYDLGSRHGSKLNGCNFKEAVIICEGDELMIGKSKLTFSTKPKKLPKKGHQKRSLLFRSKSNNEVYTNNRYNKLKDSGDFIE